MNVRTFGQACDQITSLRMVNYKGDVLTANKSSHPDLLWASCGGGGAFDPLVTLKNMNTLILNGRRWSTGGPLPFGRQLKLQQNMSL